MFLPDSLFYPLSGMLLAVLFAKLKVVLQDSTEVSSLLGSLLGSCQLALDILYALMVPHEFPITALSTLEFSGLLTVCSLYLLVVLPSRSSTLFILVQNRFHFKI